MSVAREQDLVRKAEQEQNARYAAAIAYAGNLHSSQCMIQSDAFPLPQRVRIR